MSTKLAYGLVLAALIAGSVGCEGEVPLNLSQFRSRYRAGTCKRLVACAEMPDQATCEAALQDQPGYYATLQQDIATAKVDFDGILARRCVETIEGLRGCKQSDLAGVADGLERCDRLFTGTVATGGECFFDEECLSDDCGRTSVLCSVSLQCCPGNCAEAATRLQEGTDCVDLPPNQRCASGSSCIPVAFGQPPVCAVRTTTEGAPCFTLDGCKIPLGCDLDPLTGMGTCKRAAPTGAACNANLLRPCDDGRDVCNATTLRCTPRVPVGGACTPETCVGSASCIEGTCVVRPTLGEACDSPDRCLAGLRCNVTTMTCTGSAPVADLCS